MSARNHRSLIVTADDKVNELIEDRLQSLGHSYDWSATQLDARCRFKETKYCCILLDLKIPVCVKHVASMQNGINLLEEFRRVCEDCSTLIIVLSSHGTDGPDLAVEMMQRGADDFICMPFACGPGARTVDGAIKNALRRGCSHNPEHCPILAGCVAPRAREEQTLTDGTPFRGGDLVLYPNRVELLGHKIVGDTGIGITRKVLDVLSEKLNGKYKAYSGEELARKVGSERGQNGVADCVKNLRRRITAVLQDAGVRCAKKDVIESGGRGYRLNEWISIRREPP